MFCSTTSEVLRSFQKALRSVAPLWRYERYESRSRFLHSDVHDKTVNISGRNDVFWVMQRQHQKRGNSKRQPQVPSTGSGDAKAAAKTTASWPIENLRPTLRKVREGWGTRAWVFRRGDFLVLRQARRVPPRLVRVVMMAVDHAVSSSSRRVRSWDWKRVRTRSE